MIQREKIEELLNSPVEERRRVLQLLQESLVEEGEPVAQSTTGDQTSPAAKWLLSMAGRYSGGPGNTADRADEILRAEVDKHRGLTTSLVMAGSARLWISVRLAQCIRITTRSNNSLPAITEIAYLLARDIGNEAAADFVASLAATELTLEIPHPEDYSRSAEILRHYSDARLDFVDTLIVATSN